MLAEQLGDFPLALAVAVAYMRRCDLSCAEYSLSFSRQNARLLERAQGSVAEHPQSIASSLSLSLENIDRESPCARAVLSALCFLAPDQITKQLLRLLLSCTPSIAAASDRDAAADAGEGDVAARASGAVSGGRASSDEASLAACLPVGGVRDALALVATRFKIDEHELLEFWGTAPLQQLLLHRGAAGAAAADDDAEVARAPDWPAGFAPPRSPAKSAHRAALPQRALREWAWTDAAAGASGSGVQRSIDRVNRDRRAEEEEVRADEAWALMKSYSLLVVKDGESRASLHRLLQLLLRSHQSPRAASVAISSCVWALLRLWRFEGGFILCTVLLHFTFYANPAHVRTCDHVTRSPRTSLADPTPSCSGRCVLIYRYILNEFC